MNRTLLASDNSANFTEADSELAVRDLRRKADVLSDDGEITEFSHQWTAEVPSEILEESEVLSDVEEILTTSTVSFMELCADMSENAVPEMDQDLVEKSSIVLMWR